MRIAPPDLLAARLVRLRDALAAAALDALLVTSLPNIAYLTGLFASAGALVVTPRALRLISDGRYSTVVRTRADEYPVIQPVIVALGAGYEQTIVDELVAVSGLRVGFETSHLSVRQHRFISRQLAARGLEAPLAETEGVVEALRLVKDPWEVERLREGGARLSEVAKCILLKVLPGVSEMELAADIEGEMRRVGFARPAFDTIVASGPNSALPHARTSERRLEDGELVVLDFGGVLDGYCTDLTRTVVAGHSDHRQRTVVRQVCEAQQAAFDAVAPGRRPEDVDAAARESLNGYGLADAFSHGTGHGLGLEVHEGPRLTRAREDHREPALASGMVMTLEPGVYFPGWGGVRIEDDVLVTDAGAEWLTRTNV